MPACAGMTMVGKAVIASEAKQSVDVKMRDGLLGRFAPRNDGHRQAGETL
jgi:hypothetical protein